MNLIEIDSVIPRRIYIASMHEAMKIVRGLSTTFNWRLKKDGIEYAACKDGVFKIYRKIDFEKFEE